MAESEREASFTDEFGTIFDVLLSSEDAVQLTASDAGSSRSLFVDADWFVCEMERLIAAYRDLWPVSRHTTKPSFEDVMRELDGRTPVGLPRGTGERLTLEDPEALSVETMIALGGRA